MSSINSILVDVAQKRGSVKRSHNASQEQIIEEYVEVWNAFNRYVQDTLSAKRTLNVTNFVKIGAYVSGKPYFSLAESFVKSFSLGEVCRKLVVPASGKDLTPIEEFNFTKAALKFSRSLSKDQVFSGLRYIVQAIGEALALGKPLTLSLAAGKLSISEGRAKFEFEAPAVDSARAPSVSDRHPPADQTATETFPAFSARTRAEEASLVPSAPVSGGDGGSSARAQSVTTSGFFGGRINAKHEAAYREALNRHLGEMEVRAGEAIRGRQDWESHVSNCLDQEADEYRKRRDLYGHNAKFVSQQILWNEAKRGQDRRDFIVGASSHAFPTFSEPPESELSTLMKKNRERMRDDLDLQVRTNNALRDLAKEKERALEDAQMRANLVEMQGLREREHLRREAEKKILAESWNRDVKIKHIWKAIEQHGSVPLQKSPLLTELNATAKPALLGSARRAPLNAASSRKRAEDDN